MISCAEMKQKQPQDRKTVFERHLGNASLFTKILFTVFAPLDPPLPTSKMMDFLLIFY